MYKLLALIHVALLFRQGFGAGATMPSSEEDTKQCLMQKKHQSSRSTAVDEKEQKGSEKNVMRIPDDDDDDDSSIPDDNDDDDSSSSLADTSTESTPKKHSKKHAKADAGDKAKKKDHKKEKKGLVQEKNAVVEEGHHKKKHHHKHHKNHHKSAKHQKSDGPSLAQMHSSGAHALNKSASPNLKELLPEPILALCYKLFKTEGACAGAVENSVVQDVTYAGITMSLRMNKFDDATKRLGEEGTWFSYDLDTLTDAQDANKMINMIDVGGNYGVVAIAAFKKHAQNLRLITVEPIPETFFFLRWNLHINGVPEIDEAALKKDTAGVLPLNSGSADATGQDLHFCAFPWSSMNSKVCDCKPEEDNCHIIPSTSVDSLADMFGKEPIAMVKMDCEGCEFKSLPAMAQPHISKRILKLAGELHIPTPSLEEIACKWDHGKLMSKCQHSKKNHEDIECGVELTCPM